MSFTRHRPFIASAVALAGAIVLTSCSGTAVEVTIPDELAAPSSSVALGETVRLPGGGSVERDGESFTEDIELGFTVVAVEQRDASLFEELDNPETFEGYVPVAIAYQVDVPDGGEVEGPWVADPYGMLASGEPAQFLDMEGFGNGDVVTKMCWEDGAVDNKHTRQYCSVLLVPEGDPLASIEWNGTSGMGLHTQEAYTEAPLTLPLPAEG